MGADMTVAGDFINSSVTLDAVTHNMFVSGDWSGYGDHTYTAGSSSVTFNGTTLQNINSGQNYFDNLSKTH